MIVFGNRSDTLGPIVVRCVVGLSEGLFMNILWVRITSATFYLGLGGPLKVLLFLGRFCKICLTYWY